MTNELWLGYLNKSESVFCSTVERSVYCPNNTVLYLQFAYAAFLNFLFGKIIEVSQFVSCKGDYIGKRRLKLC